MHRYGFFIGIVLISCAFVVVSSTRRCFQFTWLGHRYDNQSIFMNATCNDATMMARGIPCTHPLVVSYDRTWPDVHYIWQYHQDQATCELADNDVCAQYTYYFNERVENSTYMCTRAIDNNDVAITSGCYQQQNGSFVTRVCFCQSLEGAFPCNKATVSSGLTSTTLLITLAVALKEIDFGTL